MLKILNVAFCWFCSAGLSRSEQIKKIFRFYIVLDNNEKEPNNRVRLTKSNSANYERNSI